MCNIWLWIQGNHELLASLSTIALVLLTGFYVYYTRRLTKAALSGRRPGFWLDLELEGGICWRFVIANDGPGVVRNLRFEVNDKFEWIQAGSSGRGVGDLDVVRNGFPYLAAGRKMKYDIGKTGSVKDVCGGEQVIDVKAIFDTDLEIGVEREFSFDLTMYKGMLVNLMR